jgi:hypothetical protein
MRVMLIVAVWVQDQTLRHCCWQAGHPAMETPGAHWLREMERLQPAADCGGKFCGIRCQQHIDLNAWLIGNSIVARQLKCCRLAPPKDPPVLAA